RSYGWAAAQPCRLVALDDWKSLAWYTRKLAGVGAVTSCRSAAVAGRRCVVAHLLRGPCELAGSDRRTEPVARPGLVATSIAVSHSRAKAGERSWYCLRGFASDRCRARLARPL